MNATQALQIAKQLGIVGALIKSFKNGQELREYSIPCNGSIWVGKIRAMPGEHA